MDPLIIVVEDQAILAHDIIDRLKQFGYSNIAGPYASGEEALAFANENAPEIAILDIQLSGKINGIQLAKELNKLKSIPIIYLSQQQDEQTYKDSLSTLPVAFINKPFTNNELRIGLLNAIRAIGEDQLNLVQDSEGENILDDRIFVRNGRGKFHIKLDDILWLKANGDFSMIMTADRLGQEEKLLPIVSHTLSKLETKLNFYRYFVRASRSHIVNIKHVDRILDQHPNDRSSTRKILEVGEQQITVGDVYRKSVMDRFLMV